MNFWRALGVGGIVALAAAEAPAQATDVVLSRPGQITVTSISGTVAVTTAGQRRVAKVDERVRVDSSVATERKSLASLLFSNGVALELGPESEIEIEELLQAPFAGSPKPEAMKEEPSVSRTRLRLVRGELRLAVKPLKVAKGSAFFVAMPAGSARVDEGSFLATVRMSDLGLGVCTIELQRGAAEFELVGAAAPAKVPAGQRLAFAVEVDRRTGAVKVGEMPKAPAPTKK